MKLLKAIWTIGAAASTFITLATGIPVFIRMYLGIEPSGVLALLVENAPWLLPLSCLLLGLSVGFAIGWEVRDHQDARDARPRKPTRKERKAAEERERAEYERGEKRLYEQVKTLDPSLKAMLSVLAGDGTVYAEKRGWDSSHYLSEPWLSQFCEKATVDGGEYEVTASDLLGKFVERYPDALDGCGRTADMHVMRQGVAAMCFDEGYGIPQWYWRIEDDTEC